MKSKNNIWGNYNLEEPSNEKIKKDEKFIREYNNRIAFKLILGLIIGLLGFIISYFLF